jgi:hypothetical protein
MEFTRQIPVRRGKVKPQDIDLQILCYNADMSTEPEQPEDLISLYRRAFTEYGTRALWNMRPVEHPTPADALAITKALRTHGRMEGRRLAERIEELCRANR